MNISRGFTLIESIIVMVVMAIVMVTMTSFLVPQISQSADPHYQSRASALGQSIMTQIVSRSFDQQNTALGGHERCTPDGVSGSDICSGLTGAEFLLGKDNSETPSDFNDVDDFIGCWTTSVTTTSCRNLYDLISAGNNSAYHNFEVTIDVAYYLNTSSQMMKEITLVVSAGNQAPIELIAYRGNY